MTHVEIAERVKELRSESKQVSAFVSKLTEQRETVEYHYGARQSEIGQEIERLKREKATIG